MYKLMIAEDEILERKAIRIIIERELLDIEISGEAKNGDEAVEIARKTRPHIILMDIKMPGMDGLEAHKKIADHMPDVKTIILTAYDDFKYAQTAIKLGVVDYLLKPSKPFELVQTIKKAINLIDEQDNKIIQIDGDDKSLIREAVRYINENYNNNINLETVSSHIHLNPQYFSRFFKAKTGLSFIEYLSRLRIKKSKELLINTDKSISQISLKVGYIDAGYFSKVFLKYEGISPLKYRIDNMHNPTL